MTQTIRKANGRKEVLIFADYGQNRKIHRKTITWSKITLEDFIETYEGVEVSESLISDIKKFKNGFAWEVYNDCYDTFIFGTEKECRDFAYSQFC